MTSLLNVVKTEYEMEKIYSINEHQLVKIDKLYDEIWKFDEPIKNLEILLEKSSVERSFAEEERQLTEATKEKINGLQAKLECKQDLIVQEESETFEVFLDLYDKRLDALYELDLKARRLEKLGVSRARIDETKEKNNLGQSSFISVDTWFAMHRKWDALKTTKTCRKKGY